MAEEHPPGRQVDPAGAGVQPGHDLVIVVPRLGQQVQALHRRAAVDQPRDAHPVVEQVRLAADHVDLALRVTAAHVVGGGHAGDAVADDDHARDRPVEIDAAARPRVTRLGRERHGDRPGLIRAAQAMRVLSANPRRASVLSSSSSGGDRQSPPSSTATGSAPHTPIRQPASMGWPSPSRPAPSKLIPTSAEPACRSGERDLGHRGSRRAACWPPSPARGLIWITLRVGRPTARRSVRS